MALRRVRSLWGEGDARDHLGLSGGDQPLMEGGEVWIVASDDLGDDEQDGAHPRPPAADMARPAASLPLSSASGARPASLAMALAEMVPISGSSAINWLTVRAATPLMSRKAASRRAHSGSALITCAMRCSKRIWPVR